MTRLLEFATAAAPAVGERVDLLPELADGVVVLAVARLEAFLIELVSLGTRHREDTVRRQFAKQGDSHARNCDLRGLVKLVRRRVSFKDAGRRLDNVFQLIFQCSAWPSDDVRDAVLDLVLLRNLIVHSDGHDWSQDAVVAPAYAAQFKRADVLSVRRYGDLAVYSVDHFKALLFLREAITAVVSQLTHLEARVVKTTDWADSST
jgi:hypothetical protein